MEMDQTVELFCGERKAFSSIAGALGFATFTVDSDKAVSPDFVGDISTITAAGIPSEPLIVWAAPPTSPAFSNRKAWASDGSFTPETPEADQAMALVRQTIGLITAIQPKWWFLEHPKTLLRDMPLFAGFNRGYPTRNRRTIRHDEYGGTNAMETDVWTNAYWWIPRPGERNGSEGIETGRRVPPMVFSEIFDQLETYRTTGSFGPR
jgi:hypothetical protein